MQGITIAMAAALFSGVAGAAFGATPQPPRKADEHPAPAASRAKVAAPSRDPRKARPSGPEERPDGAVERDGDDDDLAPVSAIVVTARRLDAARTSVDQGLGATVYELHNETIENRPGGETGSLATILSQTPGVTLSGSGPEIRGSSAVQVHINGVLIPEAISDPADRLSSRLAESTRLITGALPAQFGFAPGGVIAVTTKNGLYQHGGQVELFAGTRGSSEPAFEWGGSASRSSLFASGSVESGRTRVSGPAGPAADDARREIGGLAFADHVIDDENRVSLIAGGSRARRRIGRTDLPEGSEETSDAFAVGTYQHAAGGFTAQGSLFAGGSTDVAHFLRSDRERRSSLGAQIDTSLRAGGGNTARAGLMLSRTTSRDAGSGAAATSAERTSLGLYLQDEWSPNDRVTINAGLRADWLRRLGARLALEPRASIVWRSSGGFTAHAGYARYASAPPLGEELAGVRLPDERDDYVDLGVQQALGPLTLGVDLYRRRAENLLAERQTPGTAARTAFAFARGRFRGAELSATYEQGPVTAWVNASFSKSQGRTLVGGESLFPAAAIAAAGARWTDLASDRPVTASAGAAWRLGKLQLSGDLLGGAGAVRTVSPSSPNGARAPAFLTVGFAAIYHARLFRKPIDLRLDLTNLSDANYVASDAANLEGGWTRFGEGRAILLGFEQAF